MEQCSTCSNLLGEKPLDCMNVTNEFTLAVYEKTKEIPRGFVMSYKDVACAIGFPKRARHVGTALSRLPPELGSPNNKDGIPWWRVIRSDGSIAMQGSVARGLLQQQLLQEEDVPFRVSKVRINECRWFYT